MATTRNWWIRGVVFGLAAVLIILIWVNREQFVPVEAGARLPEYRVRTLAGEAVELSSYRGQPLLLNIWATWCPPCVREMPALERVYQELGPKGLKIVGVSVDSEPGVINTWGRPGGDIAQFVKEHGLTFEILWDPSGEIETAYSLVGLPTTFLVDRKGRIVKRIVGWREWDNPQAMAEVRELLED